MAFLYHVKQDGSQADCWVVGEKPLVLGRGDSADAYVEDDALSRSHFLIVREKQEYFLIDLHSANGVWVNGQRVTARRLGSREFIQAGDSTFCFSTEPVTTEVLMSAWMLPAIAALPQVKAEGRA
ncbi:MAG: FHA domain-containing protein [Verrucomicrobiota bacterium]